MKKKTRKNLEAIAKLIASDMKKNSWLWFLGIAFLIFVTTDKSIPAAALLCFTGICSAISAVCEIIERNRK